MERTHTKPLGPATCPSCNHPVSNQSQSCDNCGIDLALAAYLAEYAVAEVNLPRGAPVAPEMLVPRLGEYLIGKSLLTTDQLEQALRYQREQNRQKRSILLGQALRELGLISKEKLDQAITEQILQLQAALQQSNRQLDQRVQARTAELEHALTRLADLNQIKSNFISNISHELRTPLTHIKGYVELLADESLGPVTSDQKSSLEVIQRSTERLQQLVDDLLRFSMASQGEFTLRISPMAITELFNNAVVKSRKKAEERQVSLQVVMPEGLPPVEADEEKITWVVLQLLDNAIKFTEAGGSVTLTAIPNQASVTVRVEDTGIGIPPERVAEIFEPFHQLDAATTRRFAGTGLGLALV
ncbi:MAG: histidine kinase dimerization/phospho-acceptor domain-containing protein, partial [Anaerolineales bacterium]|nr:histidine kinase dimerization/phospho-acceptor domain-containing protein [Anaerolineales bacterium]